MAQLGHKDQETVYILYTHTFYHASGILKDNYPMSHKTWKKHTLARWSVLDAQKV